ncbi:hypothetical protein D3C86_1359510 [compost metagenome]
MATMLGFTKDEWEIIGAIATCLSVVVTAAAVGVSLWLALRPDRYQIGLSTGIRVMVTQGVPGPSPEYLTFHVVNKGRRPAKVTGFGWRMGRWGKNVGTWIQVLSGPENPQLPKLLDDGEYAHWFAPLDRFLASEGRFQKPNGRVDFKDFYAVAFLSTGQEIRVKPEAALLARIKKSNANKQPGALPEGDAA